MSSTNNGSQILSYNYREQGIAEGFNKINFRLHPRGVYYGGAFTRLSDTSLQIAPLMCFYEDSVNLISTRIETTANAILTVAPSTPYVILRFNWFNTTNNYADFLSVALGSILTDDIILGRLVFNSLVLTTEFDYSRKSWSSEYYRKSFSYTPSFQVIAQDPYSSTVVVEPALNTIFFNGKSISFSSPLTSPTFSLPISSNGRTDILCLKDDGTLVIVQGADLAGAPAPIVSNFYFPLAIISFPALATAVDGSYINYIPPGYFKSGALTGNNQATFELDQLNGGPLLKNSSGSLLVRNSTDTGFVTVSGGVSVNPEHLTRKDYVDTSVMPWVSTVTYATNIIVTRNGSLYKSVATSTNQDPATDTNGTYWIAAGGGSNLIDFFTAGATVTANQWVRESTTGFIPAVAGTSLAGTEVFGIALTGGTVGQTIKIQFSGVAKGVTSGRTAGDILYLDTTAGGYTLDPSKFTYGIHKVKVGISVNATDVLICPDYMGVDLRYISNPSGLDGLTGYQVYADAASPTPTDGIGGSPTVTLTVNSTTPLDQQTDLLFTKGSGNVQGQGMSKNFSIDLGDTTKNIQIIFSFKASINYTSSDILIYLYDVTNSNLIPLSYQSLDSPGTGVGTYLGIFTPSSSQSYRLIWHVATINSNPYTVNVGKIDIRPQQTLLGPTVSPVPSYTPIAVGFGTITSTFTDLSRIGNKLYGKIRFTTGTTNGSVATLSLPPGTTASVDATTIVGEWQQNNASVNGLKRGCILAKPGDSNLYFSIDDYANGNSPLATLNGNQAILSTTVVEIKLFGCPISQWTSNVNLASDFTEYAYNTSTSTTANDTTSFASGSGGFLVGSITAPLYRIVQFNRPIGLTDRVDIEFSIDGKGWFSLGPGGINFSGTMVVSPFLVQNGVFYGVQLIRTSSNLNQIGVQFGQYSTPGGATYGSPGGTWSPGAGLLLWRVRKVSNGNMAEQVPVVRAAYIGNPGTPMATGVATTIPFVTKQEDTHNGYNTTTGVYTCPIGGVYQINTGLLLSWTSGSASDVYLAIQNNTSGEIYQVWYGSPSGSILYIGLGGGASMRCKAGDQIVVVANQNSGGTKGPVVNSTGHYHFVSIIRVGS